MYNRHERSSRGMDIIKVLGITAGLVLICLSYYFILKREIRELPAVNQEKETEAVQPRSDSPKETENKIEKPAWIDEQILDINEYSRPGKKLTGVNAIVIHYTGNPGTTAAQNRSFYAKLAKTGETSVSSHFVVGLQGEIIQCVPTDEVAYASNDRNSDTLSIEVCHEDKSGLFNDDTYAGVVRLAAYLCEVYDLEEEDVIRHYEVTGKICPKYYVENDWAWTKMKQDIMESKRTGSWEEK